MAKSGMRGDFVVARSGYEYRRYGHGDDGQKESSGDKIRGSKQRPGRSESGHDKRHPQSDPMSGHHHRHLVGCQVEATNWHRPNEEVEWTRKRWAIYGEHCRLIVWTLGQSRLPCAWEQLPPLSYTLDIYAYLMSIVYCGGMWTGHWPSTWARFA